MSTTMYINSDSSPSSGLSISPDFLMSVKTFNQIGQNLNSVRTLIIPEDVTSLNFHLNRLRDDRDLRNCLSKLRYLQILNLSGNLLESVNCIQALTNLVQLNLASNNLIKIRTGFEHLQSLKELDLSHNSLVDITGVSVFSLYGFKLTSIYLQGNKIQDVKLLLEHIKGISSLRRLTVANDSGSNPLCEKDPLYYTIIINAMPNLTFLNEKRCRRINIKDDSSIETPAIDKALSAFKTFPTDSDETPSRDTDSADIAPVVRRSRSAERRVPVEQNPIPIQNTAKKAMESIRHVPHNLPDLPRISQAPTNPWAEVGGALMTNLEVAGFRNDIQKTYDHLLTELQSERERRIKAEQATHRLADEIQSLTNKTNSQEKNEKQQVQALSELRESLVESKAKISKLESENSNLKTDAREQNDRLMKVEQSSDELKRLLAEQEGFLDTMKTERVKEASVYRKQADEWKSKIGALQRELELTQKQLQSSEHELGQLKDDIKKKTTEKNERLQESERKYKALEEEFRDALRIEAGRFESLNEKYSRVVRSCEWYKAQLTTSQRKLQTQADTVGNLNTSIRELNVQLSELTKSKEEQISSLNQRLSDQERQLKEAQQTLNSAETGKLKYTDLLQKIKAQENLLEGLRREKGLWSGELARQGIKLAQDRGQLESKIETLQHERDTARKQMETEVATVAAKSKIIHEQTEAVEELKKALLERDDEIRGTRMEVFQVKRDFEQRLETAEASIVSAREDAVAMAMRKDELKDQLIKTKRELQENQQLQESLNKEWKKKTLLIGQLEERITQAKAEFEAKEKTMATERDKALQTAQRAIEKLRDIDANFRKEFEQSSAKHRAEIEKLTREHASAIGKANDRIAEVENEMREVLQESAKTKEGWDAKAKEMGRLFASMGVGR